MIPENHLCAGPTHQYSTPDPVKEPADKKKKAADKKN
jgi:hypothetical protein